MASEQVIDIEGEDEDEGQGHGGVLGRLPHSKRSDSSEGEEEDEESDEQDDEEDPEDGDGDDDDNDAEECEEDDENDENDEDDADDENEVVVVEEETPSPPRRSSRRQSHLMTEDKLEDKRKVSGCLAKFWNRLDDPPDKRSSRSKRQSLQPDDIVDIADDAPSTSRARRLRDVHNEVEYDAVKGEPSTRRRGRRSAPAFENEDEDDAYEVEQSASSHYSFRDRRQRQSFFRYTPGDADTRPNQSRREPDKPVLDRATRYALRHQNREHGLLEQVARGTHRSKPSRRSKRVRELQDELDSINDGSDSPVPTSAGYSLRNRDTIRRTVSSYEALASAENRPKQNAYAEYLNRRKKDAYEAPHRRRRKHAASSSDEDEDRIVKRHKRELNAIMPINESGNSAQLRADVAPITLDKSVTWESVGGLKSHIDALKEMVLLPMLYPEFYAKYGVTPPSGVLFYGPPGTGKTLMARALANSCTDQHITFYMRKGADCLSKWVGEAERQLRLLFEQAKRTQPSIIFFDEIDGLAPVRSAKQDQIHASIVSTLLALMDGLDGRGRVIVIGATNRLDAIDPALRRPGRFDRELGFTLPNVEDRATMLQIHTKAWQPALAPAFRLELAKLLHGYCGADIKALCAESALVALHRTYPQVYRTNSKLAIDVGAIEVTRHDFYTAFQKVKPASHRSHQALAQPLSALLVPLLEDALHDLVARITAAFPVATQMFDRSAVPVVKGPPGPSIYIVAAHDATCHACGGDVAASLTYLCDTCPRALHHACAPVPATEGSFTCAACAVGALAGPAARLAAAQSTRLLLHGPQGMGQGALLAALLHRFERLLVFSLDLPSLLSDANHRSLEEAMLGQLKEAKKSTPSVVVLPHLDIWWQHTSATAHALLALFLTDCQHLPLLVLATAAAPWIELPAELQQLFPPGSLVVAAATPTDAARRLIFQPIFASFALPPAKAPRLAVATLPELAPVVAPVKEELLVVDDALTLKHEQDAHHLRELRIFLSMVLDYCMTQKKNAPFLSPVDPDEVPTYYSVITRPMDLSFMREKVNDGEYDTYESFLKDIQLIVRNANEFNPRGCPTRYVAHAAATMQDNVMSFGHRFRQQQGYDLFAKCREISKSREAETGKPRQRRFAPARKARLVIEDEEAADEDETATASDDAKVDDNDEMTANAPDVWPTFAVGDKVFVQKRTMPGMNKPGGAGIVSKVHDVGDGDDTLETYSVKYVLGGSEKRIHPQYMSLQCDDVLDNSTTRRKATTADAPAEWSTYAVSDKVFVQKRTMPGMNKLGGAGIVSKVHEVGDGDDTVSTYTVKYVLGGLEKRIHPQYMSRLTDDVVKDSMARRKAASDDEVEAVPTAAQLEKEHFDSVVWPTLYQEGWQRVPLAKSAGEKHAHILVSHVPTGAPTVWSRDFLAAHDDVLWFSSRREALAFIRDDPELSAKCFGLRYLNENATTTPASPRHTIKVRLEREQREAAEAFRMAQEDVPAGVPASAPPADDTDVEAHEPDFVVDEGAFMDVLADAVVKTHGWSVDKLQAEAHALYLLGQSHEASYDRTLLLEAVAARVQRYV
ncbi:ATPase [Achlya hypogyna]|uniref:ATPase n=1 Tax=Achlya hypogyna TaxID=1202772 RepID=A0A1V9ZRP8_ACHHY|nr:ATPase [Achlya hypogyna]